MDATAEWGRSAKRILIGLLWMSFHTIWNVTIMLVFRRFVGYAFV